MIELFYTSNLAALLLGFCLDLLLGDPHWAPHPVRAIRRYLSKKPQRKGQIPPTLLQSLLDKTLQILLLPNHSLCIGIYRSIFSLIIPVMYIIIGFVTHKQIRVPRCPIRKKLAGILSQHNLHAAYRIV